MDIPLGAPVYCDHELCGLCTHVVVDPSTNRLTHIVITQDQPTPAARVVPVEWVEASTPQRVHLRGSKAELAASTQLHVEPTLSRAVQAAVSHARLSSPALALRHGAWAEAGNGYAVLINMFLIDPDTHCLTHVVVHEAHIWGERGRAIPARTISRIAEDSVRFALDIDNIEGMPSVPVQQHRAADR